MGPQLTKPELHARLAAVLVLFILVLNLSVTVSPGQSSEEKSVVASVNGKPITRKELSQRAQIYRIFMSLRGVPLFAEFLMETEGGETALDMYRNFVLDRLIREELMLQKAESMGITVPEKEIKSRLDGIIDKTNEVDNREELLERLERDRRSLTDLKEEIYRKLIQEKLRGEVASGIEITHSEVKTFYKKNRDSFRGKNGDVKPLKEVSHQIREKLRKDERQSRWKKWLNNLEKKADIVNYLEN